MAYIIYIHFFVQHVCVLDTYYNLITMLVKFTSFFNKKSKLTLNNCIHNNNMYHINIKNIIFFLS